MWKKIVDEFKKFCNEQTINTFINPLHPIKESREEIVVACPSKQFLSFLEKNGWIKQFQEITANLFENSTKISFVVKKMDLEEEVQTSLPFSEEKPKSEKVVSSNLLFKEYTFENFVSGPSNQTVYAAAQGIAKNPGIHYNPFFIYGDSGLGKTHIIHAIGNHIVINKNKSVYYSTANKLMNDYIVALKTNNVNNFRQNIFNNEVLLIDDIQFLSNKKGTQEEFFYIFNDFFNKKKQIVITSDKYISEIKDIDDRLRSRFVMGVSLDIKPPEYETRIAIIVKKTELYKIDIDEETVKFIAANIKNNVREIEGALTTLKITSELMNVKPVNKLFAEKILKNIIKKKGTIEVDEIIKITAINLHVKVSDIVSNNRSKQISRSRQIAIYLTKKYTSKTLKEIGEKFGKRNHATVISSISTIEKVMNEDMNVKKIVDKIEREIEELNNVS